MTEKRCPYCRDLFVVEHGRLPKHFLDVYAGTVECAPSQLAHRIASGIRQAVADRVTELGFHEPDKDISELDRLYWRADEIAAYITGDMASAD